MPPDGHAAAGPGAAGSWARPGGRGGAVGFPDWRCRRQWRQRCEIAAAKFLVVFEYRGSVLMEKAVASVSGPDVVAPTFEFVNWAVGQSFFMLFGG